MSDARSRLIVALDLPDRTAALSAVKRLTGHVGYFKLGLEIFVSEGPRLVEEIRDMGESIFGFKASRHPKHSGCGSQIGVQAGRGDVDGSCCWRQKDVGSRVKSSQGFGCTTDAFGGERSD